MFASALFMSLHSRLLQPFRQCSIYKSKLYRKTSHLETHEALDELIKKLAPRLIYNTVVEKKVVRCKVKRDKARKKRSEEPLPVTLKYLTDDMRAQPVYEAPDVIQSCTVDFPYKSRIYNIETCHETPDDPPDYDPSDLADIANEEVRRRHEHYKVMNSWMTNYDSYDDRTDDSTSDEWQVNYGTPDPKSRISNVPCGGCGAFLHCKDTAIPGYIPSEIFKNTAVEGGSNLQAIICQRCHFLKHHDVALQVQVVPDDYPKVLSTISRRRGLVILMVDLLDFPCSIWPGIGDIFGNQVPIVVVGNKVDLLVQDSKDFLKRMRQTLLDYVKAQGFATCNIQDVALISAKTGYGVEDLITKLHNLRGVGDAYIVGCTNVGKSSLFNALLQSDYCKNQAMDLVQRATTSVWPGTTLNLLKFPIKRPLGYRQYLRHKRLQVLQKIHAEEAQFRKEQLKATRDPKYASLIGHIGVTKNPYSYTKPGQEEAQDLFIIRENKYETGVTKMGIDENSKEYADSKWCYDTPGVVQPDQIIHLLTTEELLLTLPKQLIMPRTYCVKPGSTLFIGGLSRLDYVFGRSSVRLTVFASSELPVTICETEDAEELYEELLGTALMRVPMGGTERMAKWPKLKVAKEFTITGVDWKQSTSDVVLSSSGWVALTGDEDLQYSFRAWTPEKRGVYVRDCLLPHAVALTGKRIRSSVAYHKYKFFVQ